MLNDRIELLAANQQPHVSPKFAFIEAVETMTRRDTRFAAAARVEVNFKRVLFAFGGAFEWN